MNLSIKTIEKMKILTDMSVSLCNRIYYLKSQLLLKTKQYSCLYDNDIIKIRTRLEKKFPSIPTDTKKYADWEIFFNHACQMTNDLKDSYDLCLDISDFSDVAKELLKGITVSILDFKLSRNRPIMLVYLNMIVAYIRVMKMFDSIYEKNCIIAIYTAAYSLYNDRRYSIKPDALISNPMNTDQELLITNRVNRLKLLLADCIDLNRHFIDFFSSSITFIKPVLLQLKDTMLLMNKCEDLRKDNVLNPINEGENMGMPALKVLNNFTKVSMYTELMSIEQYYDYVAYIFIAFPAFLFQDQSLELLKILLGHRFIIPLWRDLSINIHEELEIISFIFPNPSDNLLAITKGVKLSSILKGLSRASLAAVGIAQQSKRSYIEAELNTLNQLIATVPGLIGPKFPMLLTVATLAKNELVAYFRHADSITSNGSNSLYLRKDSKIFFNQNLYTTEDAVASLWYELSQAIVLIKKHSVLINNYYLEYLSISDTTNIVKLMMDVDDKFEGNFNLIIYQKTKNVRYIYIYI